MKAKEFVKKYKLGETTKFNRDAFVKDMSQEFLTLFESTHKNINVVPRYDKVVTDIKTKWDAIFNKSILDYESAQKFWNYFFATFLVKFRDSLFPGKEWKQVKHDFRYANDKDFARRYDEYKWHKEMDDQMDSWARDSMHSRFTNMYANLLQSICKPPKYYESLEILGLDRDVEISVDLVTSSFKARAKTCHPDTGGTTEGFKTLNLAKDYLLEMI